MTHIEMTHVQATWQHQMKKAMLQCQKKKQKKKNSHENFLLNERTN